MGPKCNHESLQQREAGDSDSQWKPSSEREREREISRCYVSKLSLVDRGGGHWPRNAIDL